MKLLALDYGRARIGVAACDSEGLSVRGLPTIHCQRVPDTPAAIAAIAAREKAQRLIVGLPMSAGDEETRMSGEVRAFAAEVGRATGLEVVFVDEGYSSVRAQELLRSRKRSERHNKENVDRIAACLILEEYLRLHGAGL
jgi:putative Holliday junction resolvase